MAPDGVGEHVLRDRDGIFAAVVHERLAGTELERFPIAPRAPWQDGFAERFVGTIRRELLDHVLIVGEEHLRRLVCEFVRFCSDDRPHTALDGDAPPGRVAVGPELGEVTALPRIGGLHHRCSRAV